MSASLKSEPTDDEPPWDIFECARNGDVETACRLVENIDVNGVDAEHGMAPLHYAVGHSKLAFCEFLLAQGARFFPDKYGRTPSSIAAICRASEEVQDWVLENEP